MAALKLSDLFITRFVEVVGDAFVNWFLLIELNFYRMGLIGYLFNRWENIALPLDTLDNFYPLFLLCPIDCLAYLLTKDSLFVDTISGILCRDLFIPS